MDKEKQTPLPGAEDPELGSARNPAHIARLSEIRRRRRRRRIRIGVALGCTVLVALVVLSGILNNSFAQMGDWMDTVGIALTPGGGYPLKTDITQPMQTEELAGGFAQLGEKDLVLYASSGRLLRSIQPGFARPAMTVGGARLCVYDRSGTELRVESRTRTLYQKSTEAPLLLCNMSENGTLAVVTRTGQYAVSLQVYSPSMELLYTWMPAENQGTPTRIAFAPDNKRLAVGSVVAQDGQLGTCLTWLDVRTDELVCTAQENGSTLLQLQWISGKQLLAIYDNQVVVYNASNGEAVAHYTYDGKTLRDVSVRGKNTALLLADSTSATELVLLNSGLAPTAQQTIANNATQVVLARSAMYVLADGTVHCFSLSGRQKWEGTLPSPATGILGASRILVFTGQQVAVLDKAVTR